MGSIRGWLSKQPEIETEGIKVIQHGRGLFGLAIKMLNGTGAASVKGTIVTASATVDNHVIPQNNEFDAFGVIAEDGVADGGEVFVIITGVAQVLLADTDSATRGQLAICSPTDGRMTAIDVPSASPAAAEHFKECGHILNSVTAGTDKLVNVLIHFN